MGLLNQVYLRNDFDELSRLIESFLHADNDGIITCFDDQSTMYL